MDAQHVDVLIVGAGLSGIGAGCHLQMHCPGKSYAVLEARDAIGGTWDLFRYPGVRSDSDMYTLGYSFRPWTQAKAIADGPSILSYVRDTARDYGVDQHIRFNHAVKRARWSSSEALWTVDAEIGPERNLAVFTCNFLFMCSGYYDYAEGHNPEFPGAAAFGGRIVHPQHWPEDLDYAGKRVVVIGSGATAVTLVPAMAEKAAHVVMLQRSPTYVVSRPAEDAFANKMRDYLPGNLAYSLARWRNVLLTMFFYQLARRRPAKVKENLIALARQQLGGAVDVETHFRPRYNPWDQRLCLVPDGDLFRVLKAGTASVVTDQIECFTETGILTKSGTNLQADIIVTATGLKLKLLSGLELFVDDKRIDLAKTMNYKGMMNSDIPNMASSFGYTNASWTLKSDLTAAYVCRLLNYMDQQGYAQSTPRRTDPSVSEEPFLDFTSGYVQRAIDQLPKQGSKKPWKLYQNYILDLITLRFGPVNDGTMEFVRRQPAKRAA
ncbi:MAG TPA: NAD(P)/FAD-dependent oxidoreductase [Acidiphilium sp.]|nr:MAG: FAD-containing monooxygenase EthA [Acidiphilium sp. 21-60-14]OYV91161.1 MAG: FAD-containing monooxygenase EthA [Acidiphilium sp. 37-60-79]OZB39927.1 MAG: FAD-containing monooxygenase EthA [Acidiphilium sp. 34-60-192]HQT87039.1 NAD(P)/FAD-dependent oxidoreductase [Acidiphilium sp.]HQU22914.1 NAD(P)/FAD-dependent oxidoreductase [Acidiphilium sp.]